MAGFAFARLRFPARHLLFILLLASLMVPNQVTVIPIFLLMRTFGLIDTHLSIILPGLVSAFGVFMMRQFYLSLPRLARKFTSESEALVRFWRFGDDKRQAIPEGKV
jgi:multiple sugar transport system permease protein